MQTKKKRTLRKSALITGAAGFIGYFVCKRLLKEGFQVFGVDDLNDYYDVNLKKSRQQDLLCSSNFKIYNDKIQAPNFLLQLFEIHRPQVIIHLAAQAGVRHSITNPRLYLESNIFGTFELLEAARAFPPKHMLLASTSSTYGANSDMPFTEISKTDNQMSFYAATKKSTENMAHSYAHLFHLPTTMFRFFTVYGPWGRPDMALFKFTKAIFQKRAIDVYNYGKMERDFTYIEDLVEAIFCLISCIPKKPNERTKVIKNDSLSPVAPFRILNIGNSKPEKIMDFIQAIEKATGFKAEKNMLTMQPGDVVKTWADTSLLQHLTDYKPGTDIQTGVNNFVDWYRKFYKV